MSADPARALEPPPGYRLRPDLRGTLRIWRPPDPQRFYVIGADPGYAEGHEDDGIDYCAAVVIACDSGEQVATFHAKMEAPDFAHEVMKIGSLFGGPDGLAYVVPELNGHGLALVARLRALSYWNLYTRRNFDNIQVQDPKRIGWLTTQHTRSILINLARAALKDQDIRIRDELLIQEMMTFIRKENGKEEHMDGCHDDLLFAWMLALEGRNRLSDIKGPEAFQPVPQHRDAWVWDQLEEKVFENEELRYVQDGGYDDGW